MPNRLLLHYGYDGLLTETRIQVLEQAGYEVVSAGSGREALRLLGDHAVALVIVCHSVPPEETEQVLPEMKRLSPLTPILIIHLGGLTDLERRHADGFVDGLRGPDHLLARIANFAADTTAAAN
jgi:DNA-binding response OmpR family regulator